MQISDNSVCKPSCLSLKRHGLFYTPILSNKKLLSINEKLQSVNKSLLEDPELINGAVPIEVLSSIILESSSYDLADLLTNSREPRFVKPKVLLGAFLHLKYGYTLKAIGFMLGQSHSSIIHYCRTLFSDCNNPEYLKEVSRLEQRLNLQLPGLGNLVLPFHQLKSKYHDYRIR